MNKHTPGPWHAIIDNMPAIIADPMKDGEGYIIADITSRLPTCNADATLISAAPDMFDSLIECLAIVRVQNGNRHADINEIMQRAEAAIAKAIGQ